MILIQREWILHFKVMDKIEEFINQLYRERVVHLDKEESYVPNIYDYLSDKGKMHASIQMKREAFLKAKLEVETELIFEYPKLSTVAQRQENRDKMWKLNWVKIPEPLNTYIINKAKIWAIKSYFDDMIRIGKPKIF